MISSESATGRIVGAFARRPGPEAESKPVIPKRESAVWRIMGALARTNPDRTRADLDGAVLFRAILRRADLHGANLRRADLYGANLYGADLRGADLTDARLSAASLFRADLTDARLSGANLEGADLTDARLDHVLWSDSTRWPPPMARQLRARSDEIRPGEYRVRPPGGNRDPSELLSV